MSFLTKNFELRDCRVGDLNITSLPPVTIKCQQPTTSAVSKMCCATEVQKFYFLPPIKCIALEKRIASQEMLNGAAVMEMELRLNTTTTDTIEVKQVRCIRHNTWTPGQVLLSRRLRVGCNFSLGQSVEPVGCTLRSTETEKSEGLLASVLVQQSKTRTRTETRGHPVDNPPEGLSNLLDSDASRSRSNTSFPAP
ncbi:hypothetical protein BHM03_00041537 [Ensete ventricosum]|nr:hypothetical protein BHM03_00041537 [Ensete ventricosum]